MKKENLTENKAEATPTGGVLVGKRQGQTMIHNKGSLSGYLVGRTHAEGGIKAVNKSTGQPLEMQGGEVVITAPAVSDNTKREFEGKMMTNREILSTINEKGGGVSFADGGEMPKSIKHTGASYKYGGKTMTDHEIMTSMNSGGHLADGFSLRDIADIHQVPLTELKKQVRLGMEAESEHTSSKREQMKIVKDHLFENPEYYTLLKKAGLQNGGIFKDGGYVSYKDKYNKKYDYDKDTPHTLEQISKDSGVSMKGLQQIYNKGIGAYKTNPQSVRPNVKSKEQWAMARVYSAVMGGKASNVDSNELKMYNGGSLVRDSKNGNSPSRDLNNYNDVLDLQADGMVGAETGLYANGGAVGLDWDTTFTNGFNKGEKLSEQEIETIDVYNDFVYGLNFKSGGMFDAKTEQTIGLLSITNNPVKLAVILEKEVDGFDYTAITYNQKIKRRLHSLAEKSNRVIVINDSKLRVEIRQFPYLLVSESDAKNYEVASEFYEKLETPRNEFKKQLTKKLENDKKATENMNNYESKTLDELRDIKKSKYSDMPIDSPKSNDEKLLDKLIAEKFSLINQEIKEKRGKEKSFESEGSTEGKGKLYEFFTPQIVADKMLALAQHYGFKGGNVLEPATGSGRLIKNLKDTNITAFEISKENFEILKREFPNAELYNYNFEKAFLKEPRFNTLLNRKGTETWLKNAPFDLVVANPPYGKFSGLYSSYFNFKGQVEHFFILQTLYLLKKGGLGVYLIPSSFLRNGIAYNDIKKQIFEIAEFVDAYRLPSNIFEKTQIGTDILILRKK
jgi:type I restriction-modification system DNA methylase subunit